MLVDLSELKKIVLFLSAKSTFYITQIPNFKSKKEEEEEKKTKTKTKKQEGKKGGYKIRMKNKGSTGIHAPPL